MDLFMVIGLLVVSAAVGGVAKVLTDISETLKRIEGRMSAEKK